MWSILLEAEMKIERPCWLDLLEGTSIGYSDKVFDAWFDEAVEPINKMLAEGVEVFGPTKTTYKDQLIYVESWTKDRHVGDFQKALLINIQPIECAHKSVFEGTYTIKCNDCGKKLKAKWELDE